VSVRRTVELTRHQRLRPAVLPQFRFTVTKELQKDRHVTPYQNIRPCNTIYISSESAVKTNTQQLSLWGSVASVCFSLLNADVATCLRQRTPPPKPPVTVSQWVIRKATLRADYGKTYNMVSEFSLKWNLLTESTLTVCVTQGVSLFRDCAQYHCCTALAFCGYVQNKELF